MPSHTATHSQDAPRYRSDGGGGGSLRGAGKALGPSSSLKLGATPASGAKSGAGMGGAGGATSFEGSGKGVVDASGSSVNWLKSFTNDKAASGRSPLAGGGVRSRSVAELEMSSVSK